MLGEVSHPSPRRRHPHHALGIPTKSVPPVLSIEFPTAPMQASHRSIHSTDDGSHGLAPEDVCFRPPEKMSPATSSSIRFLVSLSHPSLVFSLNRTVMDARPRGPILRPMPPAALRCHRLGATSTRPAPRRLSPSSSFFLLPLAQLSVSLMTSRSSTTPPCIGSSQFMHRSSPPPNRAPVAGNGLPKPGSALPRLSPPPRVTRDVCCSSLLLAAAGTLLQFEQENASASSARFAMDRRTSPARVPKAFGV